MRNRKFRKLAWCSSGNGEDVDAVGGRT